MLSYGNPPAPLTDPGLTDILPPAYYTRQPCASLGAMQTESLYARSNGG